jgi:hypothetical protein
MADSKPGVKGRTAPVNGGNFVEAAAANSGRNVLAASRTPQSRDRDLKWPTRGVPFSTCNAMPLDPPLRAGTGHIDAASAP